ncbi:MarR family transcriptional regulator [Kribbella antibiotica]|uniref:MarR family transcriptional regulator n=1 Tax=Kribbella antibiotica TaxID=190195 RepID=A0A4R5A0T2_9ACTN|nr:MarR family transcriptional regulator [Kribbella antibiotica]TDD63092.1 MarR family transcriptional regulator [Kribbella antibiotica]
MTTDRVDGILAAWQRELPDTLHSTSELVKRTLLLADELDQAVRPVLRELNLTGAEYGVIIALRREGAPYRQKPSDLSRNLFLSSGGTSNVVNQLVRRGYVDREPDPVDGRGTQIRLTDAGVQAAEEAVIAASRAHHDHFKDVPEETVEQLTELLRTLRK